jgi:hypothetical protein
LPGLETLDIKISSMPSLAASDGSGSAFNSAGMGKGVGWNRPLMPVPVQAVSRQPRKKERITVMVLKSTPCLRFC